MSSPAPVRTGLTLEEFLRLPDIEEKPYLEYIDGEIEVKVSPQPKHGLITRQLIIHLEGHIRGGQLGATFPELRCTFAGRSIIPDLTFLLDEHIATEEDGTLVNRIHRAPDIHIEIGSPDQPAGRNRRKLEFSTSNGCPLGWFIDPERRSVEVYRPGCEPERLEDDGVLTGEPVLPGYRLPVAEMWGWLVYRRREPGGERR